MKKNSLFSFGLYREMLHQTRILGLIPLILMLIGVGLSFSAGCISQQTDAAVTILTSDDICSTLYFNFVIMAPILTLTVFQFLNHRSQSDFYHAIPHKRQCLALSSLAAVTTWLLIYAVVPVGCGTVLFKVFLSKKYFFDAALLWTGALNAFVLSLLVMSAFFLAMTVTGTRFSNFIVALLILFLPRFFLLSIHEMLSFDIIPAFSLPFPFGPHNMLFNLFFGGMVGNNSGLYPFSLTPFLYTAILALFYVVLGVIFFKRRPSEAAGNPAPSRKIQAFHRIVLTCAIAFPLTLLLIKEPPTDAERIFLYVVGYLIAIVVYFLYELISTRTVRRMVKIIPGLLIVVAVSVGGTLLSQAFYNTLLNDTPDADKVKAVYVEKICSYYDLDLSYGERECGYFDSQVGTIPLTDETCIQIGTDTLAKTVEKIKNDTLDPSVYYAQTQWVQMKIECNSGRTLTRFIPLSEEDTTFLCDTLTSLPAYKEIFYTIPPLSSVRHTLSLSNLESSLSDEQLQEVYQCLYDEIKEMKSDEWYNLTYQQGVVIPNFADMQAVLLENGKTYYLSLPVTAATPKTVEKIQCMLYDNFDAASFKSELSTTEEEADERLNDYDRRDANLSVKRIVDGVYVDASSRDFGELFRNERGEVNHSMSVAEKREAVEKWNAAIAYLADNAVKTVDITKSYLQVDVWNYVYNAEKGDESSSAVLYFPYDGQNFPPELAFLEPEQITSVY